MSDNYLLEKHNFKMQKKYGQNFLTDVRIPSRIADGCTDFDVTDGKRAESLILEVGPGAGILTKELAKRFTKVLAVEIDEELIPVLADSLQGYDNITVINQDVMKVELAPLLAQHRNIDGKKLPVSVCANLPYYITTPILMYLIESGLNLSGITVMVQNEVAQRLASKPGSAEYGAVTVAVAAYGTVKKILHVPAGNFYPAPKVDSAVIQIVPHETPICSPKSAEKFRGVVRAAFAQRRKKLSNAISSAYPNVPKERISDAIERLGLSPDVRGERLSCKEFSDLSDLLFD